LPGKDLTPNRVRSFNFMRTGRCGLDRISGTGDGPGKL